MRLTKQESLFFDRVVLKMQTGMSMKDALVSVLDDDARLLETVVIMRDDIKKDFVRGLSNIVYETINHRKGGE